MIRRQKLLQQMGIIEWELSLPVVLQGEVTPAVVPGTELVIVVAQPFSLQHPLVQDLLLALQVASSKVCCMTVEQFLLQQQVTVLVWAIGVELPHNCAEKVVISPELTQLCADVKAKRELWQQLCDYEQHLFPH